MTIVSEYDWESDTWAHRNGDQAARAAWREAVQEIAERAKVTLPDCAGRVDAAVKLVLAGDVALLDDGQPKVASQSNGQVVYHIVNGACTCKDFPKAPSGWCKHRIAYGLALRVQARLRAQSTPNGQVGTSAADTAPAPDASTGQSVASTAPLPEAPVSITLKATLHGHEVLVTLRGIDFASVKAQVEAASAWLQAQSGPAASPVVDTPQCPTHGAMKPSTKGKGWYCPQKLADGSWCKGR